MAIANSKIVAGQCAVYCACSVSSGDSKKLPKSPSVTEYARQIKANKIG